MSKLIEWINWHTEGSLQCRQLRHVLAYGEDHPCTDSSHNKGIYAFSYLTLCGKALAGDARIGNYDSITCQVCADRLTELRM